MLLIIDTSTEKSLIAFSEEANLLLTLLLPVGLQSSRHLLSVLNSGFKKLKKSPADLDAIAVTVGPGSFTGIRVGVAVAKGIAFAQSVPLISLCSLSGFTSSKEGPFVSMIDAKSQGAYALYQERCADRVKEISKPRLVSKEELSHELNLVGPADCYPDAAHLAGIAYQKFLQNDHSDDLNIDYLSSYTNSCQIRT